MAAFVQSGSGLAGGSRAATCCRRKVSTTMVFDSLWENIQKQVVKTPGVKNAGLEDCPFCEAKGKSDCDGCRGTGKDRLGTCILCDGKGKLECGVCRGVGKVDVIRKGGTDNKGEFTKRGMLKKKGITNDVEERTVVYSCAGPDKKCDCYTSKSARPPLTYADEGPLEDTLKPKKKYALCSCGQSTMFPYCGGVHIDYNKETGLNFQPYEISSPESKDVVYCRCGHSQNRPYCDGTHAELSELPP